jgi:AraC family transcriptional regulator
MPHLERRRLAEVAVAPVFPDGDAFAVPFVSRQLHRGPDLLVAEYRCSSGPEDAPYEERFCSTCIALVRGGSFALRSSKGTAALGPGSFVLGNAGQPYTCSHAGHGDVCLSFAFGERFVEDVARGMSFRRPALPASAKLAWLAARVEAIEDGEAIEELAVDVLGRALHADATGSLPPPQVSTADERRAQQAMRFLEAHADEPIALRALAARARVSAFHFLRSFRAAAGTTPHQYLLATRLRRAAALLLRTDEPVTDIAFRAGFGDLSNFIRTFRRATGRSPRAFRAAGRAVPVVPPPCG